MKYPVGIQTFSEIIEDNYTYVDKTGFVAKLVQEGKYYFLSRPRRFGKSLLLSTMQAYFEGRRELFKGLLLDEADVDWTPSPVFHFDFNTGTYDEREGLESLLCRYLYDYEKQYGLQYHFPPSRAEIPLRFSKLIETACKASGRKVVILVDEYDKPLLSIEEQPLIFHRNQNLLKAFFSNLKSMDRYIRFAFLTGVARFSKVSIFSDLNNLNDISLSDRYADICGWTEEELTGTFREGIRQLALKRNETPEHTLLALKDYYDGYLFSEEGHHLYNPFSVLLAMSALRIEPYWFETGTPTFLVRRVRAERLDFASFNNEMCSREDLLSVSYGTGNPIPLMFQTGYLTIGSYDKELKLYRLRFPNREVEQGFAKSLLPLYVPEVTRATGTFSIARFREDLAEGRPDDFMKRLETLLKDMPYEHHDEKTYQNILYLICTLSGTDVDAERHGYKGRSDIEVRTRNYIYIFECKFNRSVEEAVAQLRERDYAGRYALDTRSVFLIGANFSDHKSCRGLSGYHIEKI